MTTRKIVFAVAVLIAGGQLATGAVPSTKAAAKSGATAAPAGLTWRPLYEPGGGGAIVSLQISPHDTRRIVSGGDMLGVATSTDRGESWQSTFGFTSYEMGDVTFHPTDRNVIWIGSCMGPYVSADGGIHWQPRRGGMPPPSGGRYTAMVEKILFDPSDAGRLLAFGGTSRRWNTSDTFGWVWESPDSGQNWRHLATLTPEGSTAEQKKGVNIIAAAFAATNPRRVYALAERQGVYISDDAGRTWQRSARGLPHTGVQRLQVHPSDPDTLWVSLSSHKPEGEKLCLPGGIFKSADGGKTFLSINGNLPQDRHEQNTFTATYGALAVSPVDPDVIWTCDGRWNTGVVYKTADGGKTWKAMVTKGNVGRSGRPDDEAVKDAFRLDTATFAGLGLGVLAADPKDPNVAYGFNSEFVIRTTDGGRTWTDITALRPDPARKDHWRGRGWVGWCATNFAWNPYKPGQSIAQALDAGRGWISDDGLRSWRYAITEPHPWMGGQDVTFTRDGYIYISTGQHGGSNGLLRSTDGGRTWTLLAGEKRGLPDAGWGKKPEYAGIYAHPEKGKLVWVAAGDKILHSQNAGESWGVVRDGLGAGFIAGDPTRPGRFYVKARDGVYVTDDGRTFTNIGGPHPAGRGRINCDSRGRVYACQWREGRTGVWRYTPETSTWERLLDEPLAFEVNADPSDPDRLLLITNQDPYNDLAGGSGVWVSANGGGSWGRANDGLAMLRGCAVAFNPHDPEQVVVGTFGRGFFLARWPKGYKPRAERRDATIGGSPSRAGAP